MASYANSMANLHSGSTPTASQSFGLMGTSIKLASRSELSLNGGGGSMSLHGSRNNLTGSKNNLSSGNRAGSTYKLSSASNPRLASSTSSRTPPVSRPKSSSSHRTLQAGGSDAHGSSRSTLLIDGLDPHHVLSSIHAPVAAGPPIVLPPKQAWGDQASRYHLVSAVLPSSSHHHPAPNASSNNPIASTADMLAAHANAHAHQHTQSHSSQLAAAAMTIPTPPHSPTCPASPATDDAMSVASSSSSEEYSPRKTGRARNPLRRADNASGSSVNSQDRFYDWKQLKQQTHRRNTENWAMESIVVRRLRYLVDHIDELDGKHLGLLTALEESGVTNAQLQQYFPYVTSIHDLKLHLTTLLMDRQHRQRHPHHPSDHASSSCTSDSSLALSASQLAPAVPGAPTPRTLNRASPAAPPPTYPRGAPTVARRAFGHKKPLVTPVEVLKIVEQFNPVSLAVQDAMNAVPVSRAAAAKYHHHPRISPAAAASSSAGTSAAVRASIKSLERTQHQAQGGGGARAGMDRARSRNEVGMSLGAGSGGAGYVK